jgi:hypothetical protein
MKRMTRSRYQKVSETVWKGEFLPNPSPQKHILVSSIEPITLYQNPYSPGAYA